MGYSIRICSIALVATATAGCMSPPRDDHVKLQSPAATPVTVGPIRFDLPNTWVVKRGDFMFKATSDRNENLYVSVNLPPKWPTDRKLSATDLLNEYMDMLLTGQYEEADMQVAMPSTPFWMVCKEPAAKVAYTYTGKEYLVTYAIAQTDTVYQFNFYGEGDWTEAMHRFDSIVKSARLMVRAGSAMGGEVAIPKRSGLEVEYSGARESDCP